MNTTPIMTRSTTENILMIVFITGPRYFPTISEIEAPLFLSDSIPDR